MTGRATTPELLTATGPRSAAFFSGSDPGGDRGAEVLAGSMGAAAGSG